MSKESKEKFDKLSPKQKAEIAVKMLSNLPDAKAMCEIAHAGQCGTCSENGGWTPCG